MIFLYRILINFIFIFSPIIIIIRLLKKKENFKRFKEKFCFFSKQRSKGNIIWFHGASVGELQSILPLLEKIEKNKNIKQVLVTSNTLSSSKIIQKIRLKKVIHQFFPMDTNYLSLKFINYWKPSSAFFIDSEIWPNMIVNLKKNNVPIFLINGRITNSSFKNWNIFKNFSKMIFSKIDVCLSSSLESKNYLKKLGANKVKFFGNLKFSQAENEKIFPDKNFKKFILKKNIWCASSTHNPEEIFCGLVHKRLKKKYKNLLTIIIPRHIERTQEISNQLQKLNLNVHTSEPKKKIKKKIDIYLVNSYGKTKSFFVECKNVFLGGSIANRGGQNPLEATRYGCNILHGPNISNFKEIYGFLKKQGISKKVTSEKKTSTALDKLFLKRRKTKRIQVRMKQIGNKVLEKTYKEVKSVF